ncbi:hypothetical protein ON010_g2380 [Phytophthora cinnamomi]|nr:hypothetical protein ON010_g2380 [Phytophthora cinnamomi]
MPTTQVSSPEDETSKTEPIEENKLGENCSDENKPTQAPSTEQGLTQAPWTQAAQTTLSPSMEQHSMNFSNLNGGTGTVEPSNLRQ